MNYAVILAGGVSVRVKSTAMPKQFLSIGGKPILSLTVDKFLLSPLIDKIVVSAPHAWISHTQDILSSSEYDNVDICEGGGTRQESLYNGLLHIKKKYGLTKEDICVSHDAARPFISLRIITDNVEVCREKGSVDTVIPAMDTIAVAKDAIWLDSIPARHLMYQGQTPQSFFIEPFLSLYESLDQEYLHSVTDATRILLDHNIPVAIVHGEQYNMKITTDFDLSLANFLVNGLSNA